MKRRGEERRGEERRGEERREEERREEHHGNKDGLERPRERERERESREGSNGRIAREVAISSSSGQRSLARCHCRGCSAQMARG